jgi:MFS family permease
VPPRLRARRVVRDTLDVPRAARRSLAWDIAAGCCAGAFTGICFPFVPRIARGDLHAAEWAIGLMAAAPFVGNLLSPIWARQMEGRAKMPFCLGSWIPARFLLLLMPFAATAPVFVGLIFSLQFIGTISAPAYTALMREIYPDRARGRLMGYVRVGANTAAFLGTMIAGRLLDHVTDYRTVFPVAGLFGMGAAAFFSRVRPLPQNARPEVVFSKGTAPPEERPTAAAFVKDTLGILRRHHAYRWFALSVFTYGFGNLMVGPLYSLYQTDVLKISKTGVANLANLASLAAIFGFWFWGRFMDRRGAPRTVLYGILLVMLVPLVYLVHPSVPVLSIAALLMGLSQSCIELSYMQSTLTYAERGREAQYQAVHSLLLGLRGILAPLLGIPLMKAFGYEKVFTLAVVIMLVGALLQWNATRSEPRPAV